MRSLIILFVSLIGLSVIKQTTPTTKDYIEFFYTGKDTKYTRPLFISKLPLKLKLQKQDEVELQASRRQISSMTEKEYISLRYNLLVTDSMTYTEILNFIEKHKEYYSNPNNEQFRQICIFANGHLHYINQQFEDDFFANLRIDLNQKKINNRLMNEISKSYNSH